MGPVARIGSVLTLTIAAGALPTRANSNIINEPVLDPLPKGNASTFPATLRLKSSWRGSLIWPLAGSTPPQKLIGCEVVSTSPFATPGTTQHAFNFLPTVIPSGRFFPEPRFQRSLQASHKLPAGLAAKSSSWQIWQNRSSPPQSASSLWDIATDTRR